ncbi:MAG: M20/M25/M40 family metallo-hydrolase [Bacteroidales bacterium]|nr:M20/M25/M40 family metallo-hydrolase [Candidatus Latescibacterota bacterium]
MRPSNLMMLSFILLLSPITSKAADPVGAPIESITEAELSGHVYFLASDYLDGRYPGQPGYEIAAQYAASQFKACGLDSIVIDQNGGKSFFQTVPVATRALEHFALVSITPSGEKRYDAGDLFKSHLYDFGDESQDKWDIVFAGYGISEPESGWDDFEGLALEGKTVILLRGTPSEGGEPVLPEEIEAKYSARSSLMERLVKISAMDPAAIIVPASPSYVSSWDRRADLGMWPNAVLYEGDSAYYHWINADIPRFLLVGSNLFLVKQQMIEELMAGQQYEPFMPDSTIREEEYRTFELGGSSIGPEFTVKDEDRSSPNVVAMLPGTDPVLKDEYIVIGSHIDHFASNGGPVMNGADDNASGAAGVIEIAEALAIDPPRRSVIFVMLNSEETGLLGARYFAHNCPVPLDKVVAYINVDMIGRTVPDLAETRGIYISGADRTCDECWDILQDVNERTSRIDLVLEEGGETTERSDELPFFSAGIPTYGFCTGMHEDYHRPGDDPEKLEYDKMEKVCRLIYSLIVELADRDERPCGS